MYCIRSGRATDARIFFEQLALHAGYLLEWDRLEPEPWQKAIREAVAGDLAALTAQLTKVVSPAR